MKLQPHIIASLNPTFEKKDGILCASPSKEKSQPAVHDLKKIEEQQILDLINGFDDCCSTSLEVEQHNDGHYINVQTVQFLKAFDLSTVSTALEISNDFGNLTRFLGEEIESVESIKPNVNAAKATVYRCADLIGVSVVSAPLDRIKLPTNHYDFILLTTSEIESLFDVESRGRVFQALSNSLTPNGVLALICQNHKPISAWFSAQQDIPYKGLYEIDDNVIAKQRWLDVLQSSNLTQQYEHCFLPNSNLSRTLLSKDYLSSNKSALSHFYAAGIAGDEHVNEYLLFTELAKTQDLFDLCDSYLILSAKKDSDITALYNNDFTHFSSVGRQRRWATLTTKPADQPRVLKCSLYPNETDGSLPDDFNAGIQQDLSEQPYCIGQSLAGLWLNNLIANDSFVSLPKRVKEYHEWLVTAEKNYGDSLYDLLPFNLIVNAEGRYQVIDREWSIKGASTPEFVLFRALFWFGFQNRHLLGPLAKALGLFDLEDWVRYGLELVGYQPNLKELSLRETQIQGCIEKQFNLNAIEETLILPIGVSNSDKARGLSMIKSQLPRTQVFWYDSSESIVFGSDITFKIETANNLQTMSAVMSDAGDGTKFLRVDPIDCVGLFHFTQVELRDDSGAVLWSVEGEERIAKNAQMHNVVYCESHAGNMFVSQTEDPQFIFDLNDLTALEHVDSISITVSYSPQQSDYNLAMQQLGQEGLLQKQFIEGQRSEINVIKHHYAELNDNFEFLKDNSEKQNDLIKLLVARNTEIETRVAERQEVIDRQLEMMQRTTMTRLRLFIARLRGRGQEVIVEEPEVIDDVLDQTHLMRQNNEDYQLWIKAHTLSYDDIEWIRKEIEVMPLKPKFSIVVPVYDIEEEYLMMAVDSVRNQLYTNWELCLVDDASPKPHIRPLLKRLAAMDERIVIQLNTENQGIGGASNDGLKMATGDYIGLLDHDDELSIDALYQNAKVINQNPDVGFIYSDEDKLTMEGVRVDPFFKPDYSPELLDSQNYICHFSVINQDVINEIGGFRLGFDGSQDHDLIMRAVKQSGRVIHIPKVLYHWRKVPGSTADVYDAKSYAWEAGRKAVASRLEASGEAGEVILGPLQGTYQVKRDIVGEPKVSIVIPFKDKPELLEMCINSILNKSTYQNYEIIGVSNNSEEERTHEVMAAFSEQHSNIKFVEKNVPFNFSQICNYGVSQSSGEYVLLLNNDIEVQSVDWLERLLEHAQRKDIGAVGGKLFFPDGRIQHAGVVAGMHGVAGHLALYFAAGDIGYYGSLVVTRNVSAVTGAMLMVSREKYDAVGGLDEENFAVAYNDVDFCLKLVEKGLRNIFTPFVHATHFESASRGYEDDPAKLARLEKEKNHFLDQWQSFLETGDPCFNQNFDLNCHDYKIKL